MPYILTLTNGTSLTTIADNTVNTTSTSLALVGKNYTGYGAFLNENFIKLLENSSNSAAPTIPLVGQLWWDTVNTVIKVWTGNQWKPMHASTASTTNPTNPNTGDLWWNTNALTQGGGLYVWGGSTWVFIGPQQGSSQGSTSGAIPTTIIDSNNQSHSVIELNIANQVLGIISKDAAFTPGAAIPGFGNVNPGFNLINGSGLTGSQFTGNATMALTLGVNGLSANSFMRSDQNTSTTGVLSVVNDTGLAVGNLLSVLTIGAAYSPGSGNSINFTNTTNNSDINLYVKKAGSLTKALAVNGTTGTVNLNTIGALGTTVAFANPISLSGSSTLILNAGTAGQGDIGSSASPFNNVWATTVNGNVTASGNVSASYFLGNGSQLTGMNTYANVNVTSYLNATASANAVIVANASGNVTSVSPGASGNVLISNGTNWTSNAVPQNGLGVGQTWQLVTRTMGVTYTNDTGKPIMLVAQANRTSVSTSGISITFNGSITVPVCYGTNSGGGNTATGSIIIPVGATYVLSVSSESLTSYSIWELR